MGWCRKRGGVVNGRFCADLVEFGFCGLFCRWLLATAVVEALFGAYCRFKIGSMIIGVWVVECVTCFVGKV